MGKIIIADDSTTARMIVKKCLEIIGFDKNNFIEAANGHSVLKILSDNQIDFVLTDLNMPEMDGEELLEYIIKTPELNFPIAFITSAGNEAKEVELLDKGAYCVIKKPINPMALAKKLKNLMPQTSEPENT